MMSVYSLRSIFTGDQPYHFNMVRGVLYFQSAEYPDCVIYTYNSEKHKRSGQYDGSEVFI